MSDTKNGKINFKIIWKLLTIGALVLVMLIPQLFVSGTLDNRMAYKDEATQKITDAWGGDIIAAAPILNVPYAEKKAKSAEYEIKYLKIAPKTATTFVDIKTQTRYIGIFKVPVFTADVTVRGRFEKPGAGIKENTKLDAAFVTLELNDLKGVASPPVLKWNGASREFEPLTRGFAAKIKAQRPARFGGGAFERQSYNPYRDMELKALSSDVRFGNGGAEFEMKFKLKGSNSISFVPVAKNSVVEMKSDWPNPSFSGNFLPDKKEINSKGFAARWDINYLASGIPAAGLENADLSSAAFKTSLTVPVDNYRSAERAMKYGILFITLTFLACFIFELAGGRPIHPFQYLLVGFAMALFYLLLLSISEFMPFSAAYLIAALATIGLLTTYIKTAIIKNMNARRLMIVFGAFAALYAYLYILLVLQDMALIFGSLGLFAGLAAAMRATKNIKWYDNN
ncbi:MAG: cell envelope integrity protein CreD [Rickettsiales bacterium]|jgi:inner membrane protein|nr:cell envelope integrity protein CreD [Rickettsiales bacterium]